jgi:hypothetical protein
LSDSLPVFAISGKRTESRREAATKNAGDVLQYVEEVERQVTGIEA